MSSSVSGRSGASDVEGCCASGPSAAGGLPEEPCSGLLIPVPERSLSVSTISVSNTYFVIYPCVALKTVSCIIYD